MNKCVIYGAGTYGVVYAAYLKDTYEILGFIDDNPKLMGSKFNDYSVLGNSEFLFSQLDKEISVFVPIGKNSVRVSLLEKLNYKGFLTPSFIHPHTFIDTSVSIGKAVYILASTNIMPFTTIGDFSMISMGVNIAHHVIIEKGCFFSQGTNVGASITIKEQAYCGIGSTIMTGVKELGIDSFIGAGSVIIKDVPSGAVVVGNPGRIIRYIEMKQKTVLPEEV